VYLNNSNLKFPIGLRLQGIIETNPIQGIWVQRRISDIGSKKVVLSKENGFKAREIKTGIELNDFIQVLEGWV
jgi:Cu(I)/Ag(I) efflux system membrane fusion protein